LLKQFRSASDEINAKGGVLGGRKIEIVPFDNKGTPQETLTMLNSWIRPEDHQLMSPTYITSFVKAGQPRVKYDVEGTGFGWKTEVLSKASDSVPPIRCKTERPPR